MESDAVTWGFVCRKSVEVKGFGFLTTAVDGTKIGDIVLSVRHLD